jgi:hypothetical protein
MVCCSWLSSCRSWKRSSCSSLLAADRSSGALWFWRARRCCSWRWRARLPAWPAPLRCAARARATNCTRRPAARVRWKQAPARSRSARSAAPPRPATCSDIRSDLVRCAAPDLLPEKHDIRLKTKPSFLINLPQRSLRVHFCNHARCQRNVVPNL